MLTISMRGKERLQNRSTLMRLIDKTLGLAKNGKQFCGHSEKKESVCKGMFLDFVNVLKNYDTILKNHLLNRKKMHYAPVI